MKDLRVAVAVALFFAGATAIVTFPQILAFTTSVPYHSDPYFSIWRLGWIAHAIRHGPTRLFEANIFYPEHDTLAYSDAVLLPGVVLAPLFWIGAGPVTIYNAALLAAFTLSGTAMFFLARDLTGNTAAGLIAGVIYALAPSRLTHYVHFELQIVFWIPLALLLMHRIIVSGGRLRHGLGFGAIVGCQVLSCVYAGIFLIMYAGILAPALAVTNRVRDAGRSLGPLVAAVAVMTMMVWPYAAVYRRAEHSVGARTADDIQRYSAGLEEYLSAPAINRVYGRTAIVNPLRADEMNLFPGFAAVGLATIGLAGGRNRTRWAYLIALIFAVLMTRGLNGFLYRWLFEHISLVRSLRSPARFEILVMLSLAVLSSYGVAFVMERIGSRQRARIAAVTIGVLAIVECASRPALARVPPFSDIDQALAKRSASIVVEVPLQSESGIWGSFDWLYMYQGLPHLHRMINGYSGYAPASYYEARAAMAAFPDDRSLAFLRERGVDYVVVRGSRFETEEAARVLARIAQQPDLSLEMTSRDGPDPADALYAFRK